MKRYLPLPLVLAIGACGSGGSNPAGGHTPSAAARSQSTATTTVTTSTSTTAATSSATGSTATSGGAAISVACRAANLSLSFVGEDDAAGHGLLKFALKNISSLPCHTYGFPGVLFLDAQGAALTTFSQHVTYDYFGNAPEVGVTLTPGQSASFRIGVTRGANPRSVCTTAYGLQVIPPDDTATLRASIATGAYECRDADVSPVEPGTGAYS